MTDSALDRVRLVCPVCRQRLRRRDAVLRCAGGHAFDIARHGQVNLAVGRPLAGDTAEMVAQRHAFLSAGHFRPLIERVAGLAAAVLPRDGFVVDAGGGTGAYSVPVLEAAATVYGLVVDTSTPALRRAARAHPRLAAAGWDVWRGWPLASGSADLVLNVFAPRNPAEFHRVTRPGGSLIVVTPTQRHLAEIRDHLRLLAVDTRKPERLEQALADRFAVTLRCPLEFPMRLPGPDVRRAVLMGPNAHHLGETPALSGEVDVTASFVVTVCTRRPGTG